MNSAFSRSSKDFTVKWVLLKWICSFDITIKLTASRLVLMGRGQYRATFLTILHYGFHLLIPGRPRHINGLNSRMPGHVWIWDVILRTSVFDLQSYVLYVFISAGHHQLHGFLRYSQNAFPPEYHLDHLVPIGCHGNKTKTDVYEVSLRDMEGRETGEKR